MTELFLHRVNLSDGQKQKLARAVNLGEEVTIQLSPSDYRGDIGLLLTKTQVNAINKNMAAGKGMRITIAKSNIKKMRSELREGGWLAGLLPFLIPLASAILPSVIDGVASVGKKFLNSRLDARQKQIDAAKEAKKAAATKPAEETGSGFSGGRFMPINEIKPYPPRGVPKIGKCNCQTMGAIAPMGMGTKKKKTVNKKKPVTKKTPKMNEIDATVMQMLSGIPLQKNGSQGQGIYLPSGPMGQGIFLPSGP